jgi:hypothetical protein
VLGVLILLASTSPDAATPLLRATSAKQPAEFSACFAEAQQRAGSAWSYLPTDKGGTFTDSGARGSDGTYWLQFRADAASGSQMRLFAEAAAPVVKAVEQCR